ncbi:MAG: chromosomal replication initiator protein DnaA, partial [Epsilonproteobacteria bacterium]
MTTKDILLSLQNEVSSNDYERYLKQLVYKKTSSSDELAVFEVPNKYIANFIKTKFTNTLKDIFEKNKHTKPSIEIKIAGERRRTKKAILDERSINNNSENTIL